MGCSPRHYVFTSSTVRTKCKGQNLFDIWPSKVFEIGAAYLRPVTRIAPKSSILCMNRSTVRYGFRACAKAIWYNVNKALSNDHATASTTAKNNSALYKQLRTCITFFCTFLCRHYYYDVKVPNFTFCGGRAHKTVTFFFFSWTLMQSFRIQLQKN